MNAVCLLQTVMLCKVVHGDILNLLVNKKFYELWKGI